MPLMRTVLSLVLVVGVVLTGLRAASADEGKEFLSQEGKFSVEFPGTPQVAKKPMQTKFGSIVGKIALVASSNSLFYAVLFFDYPKAVLEKRSADELLEDSRDSAVKNVKGGKLVSDEKVSLNGNPGRQIVIDAPGNLRMTLREYLVMNRLYQLIVSVKSNDKDADAKRFFDSFKLTS